MNCMGSILKAAIILILPLRLMAQESWLFIADSSSRKGLPLAAVWTGSKSFHADASGKISKDLFVMDSIRISYIGYNTRTLPTTQLADTVFLTAHAYQLPEFVASGMAPTYELGYHNEKKGFPASYSTFSLDSSMAGVYLESPFENLIMEDVVIQFAKIKKGQYFQLLLFHPDSGKLYGKLIAKKEVSVVNRKNSVTVDVSDMKIRIPTTGLCIAILYLQHDPSGREQESFNVVLTESVEDDQSFRVFNGQWFSFSMLLSENWDSFKNPFNLMIGARARPESVE